MLIQLFFDVFVWLQQLWSWQGIRRCCFEQRLLKQEIFKFFLLLLVHFLFFNFKIDKKMVCIHNHSLSTYILQLFRCTFHYWSCVCFLRCFRDIQVCFWRCLRSPLCRNLCISRTSDFFCIAALSCAHRFLRLAFGSEVYLVSTSSWWPTTAGRGWREDPWSRPWTLECPHHHSSWRWTCSSWSVIST